jgi:hypothetical protein
MEYSNPDNPIIVIGLNLHYQWQWHEIIKDLTKLGWANLLAKLRREEFEIFDISTHPQKGDAIDHITKDTPLIIALHLYGMSPDDRHKKSSHGYYYNRDNYRIYELAKEWNIPLMVLGDQPDPLIETWGVDTMTQQYFTDSASRRNPVCGRCGGYKFLC